MEMMLAIACGAVLYVLFFVVWLWWEERSS
jgi:hypothetical protein